MSESSSKSGCSVSFGLGSLLSLVISVILNHSVGWAILHFLFGWFYVVYSILFRLNDIVAAIKLLIA